MVLDGQWFQAYVEQVLAPALNNSDIVMLDGLGSHGISKVQDIIEGCGASLVFLPKYSLDLNSIENAFGKLQAMPQPDRILP